MIPLIFGAIALGSAAYGVISGINGAVDMSDASDLVESATESYQEVYDIYQATQESTELRLDEFNKFKIEIQNSIILYYGELKQTIGDFHSPHHPQFTERLESTISQQMQQYQSGQISAEEYFYTIGEVLDVIGAVDNIANAQKHHGWLAVGATKLATSVGVAGTGTAISSLSGAAAHSAALAWLGGGSLAAGGGGMALGGAILTGLTAAPALAVIGCTIAGKGSRELERAIKYHNRVVDKINELVGYIEQLEQIKQQVSDLGDLIYEKYQVVYEKMEQLENNLERDRFVCNHEIDKIEELVREVFELVKQPMTV
jgi:hypothetical protein